MADDLQQRLRWLEQELKEAEPEVPREPEPEDGEEDELGPGYNWAVDFHRAVYADEEPVPEEALVSNRQDRKEKRKKKEKSGRGQVILALLEILAILALLGWWLR